MGGEEKMKYGLGGLGVRPYRAATSPRPGERRVKGTQRAHEDTLFGDFILLVAALVEHGEHGATGLSCV
jgi:hypothetical protein